jgi:hypothetical protein
MRWLSTKVIVLLLGSLLIIGCGGGGSNFTVPGGDDSGEGEGTIDNGYSEEASSIDFISATPSIIALKGTGGPARSETSVLVFMVVDKYGNPVPNQTVNFNLSTQVGGLSLSNESAVSSSGGLVQVTVNAGNVSTHIRVHATLDDNPNITVVSDGLIVYAGLPDQNSISLFSKIVEIKIDEWDYGKVEFDVVFQAADHFNNFVPDGTVVYFTTEGGSIDGSATTSDGGCKVKWRSGNPVPDDEAITILAFCVGEESFIDVNGNGYFDPNDLFDKSSDQAEPFRDDNENGMYDIGEEFWDYNNNGKFDGEPNGIYNGSLCSDEAETSEKCTKELVYVHKSLTLMKAEVQGEWSAEEASSIDFISACPQTIALKGTGGPARSETSVLVFMAVDKYGNPVPNQIINFELSTEIGGLSLSNESAVSNSEGLVRVTVNAGNVSTHVRVHAALDSNPLITVVSDELAVSTGLPDQNSISLSAEVLNPEAWNYNNVQVPILFQAADLFNNFVPDGTVVYFTTGGGSIIASSTIKDGVCEVTWRSGNPRPDDGLFSILAFCIGEESFTDVNGNGLFDGEDWFDADTDLAEPFRDDNHNGIYDYGEWFWDYNYNGEFDEETNGIYNGTLCSEDADGLGLCTRELVYVQASVSLIMSGSFANITFNPNYVDLKGGNSQTVLISIADLNNNPMPYNTAINVKVTNGKFNDDTQSKGFNVGNTNRPGPIEFPVTLMPTEDDGTSGILQVEVTTPFGNVSTASINVEDDN